MRAVFSTGLAAAFDFAIRAHDAAHQRVAHHVGAGKGDEGNPLDPGQRLHGIAQPRTHAVGQVHLAQIAGNDHGRIFPQPGQEHLHLHGGGVLALVQNDAGIGQRAAPHEGQRRDFYIAPLHAFGDLARRHHVVQRVIKRPEVGVHLVAHVAGQKTQLLPGLDRGPGQNNPVDGTVDQPFRRLGHGEIGLAGARRPFTEHQFVVVDRPKVVGLHWCPG